VRLEMLEGNEYQALAARTINKDLTPMETELHALHGMVGEIGEIHSIYQKSYQGHAPDEEEMKKELGDLLWFVAEYCTVREWDLEDIMYMNIEKLRKRYPEGFSEDKSVNRTE
jgi:NTP pyrophosphatase (non-canonical NTP hydrolase)